MTRVISRFGRTYSELDPDGVGGGPPVWILSTPGGDSNAGADVNASGIFTPSGDAEAVAAGMAVFMPEENVVDLAQASDGVGGVQRWRVLGLAATTTNAGDDVAVVVDGQLMLADWSGATGSADLVSGRRYYLSAADAGVLTLTPPNGAGNTVVAVGHAISPRTLEVEVDVLVRL